MDAKKRVISILCLAALALTLAACGTEPAQATPTPGATEGAASGTDADERVITLSDEEITLDGESIAEEDAGDVTVSHDIVYYESGMDTDYGEGTEADEHSAEEAEEHTVVTIRTAGTYKLTGSLAHGQIAVDLGDGAEDDPDAVVTLILDNVDVTCTVAPALIFYNVYECADGDEETATYDVDTSDAGANVIIADGSENNFNGSYVARIYEPGTTSKLHKYDGAFYSKMSMNVGGESEGTGVLDITAENEGLDTEMHLTINGGVINIEAQNDGINTNEDNVSVTTINGGELYINAGLGAEGDGIDSNGWLVINGGSVFASANGQSGDSGLDASLDILLNGGMVIGIGSMLDTVLSDSAQSYLTLTTASAIEAGSLVELTDAEGSVLFSFTPPKSGSQMLLSSPDLTDDGNYTLIVDGEEVDYGSGDMFGPGGGRDGGMQMMEVPDGLEDWLSSTDDVPDDIRAWLEGLIEMQNSRPDGQQRPDGGMQPPPDGETPSDAGRPDAGATNAE